MSLLDNASNYLFRCVIQKRNLAQWFTLVSKCDMKTQRGPENCTEFRLISKIVRKISLIITIISFHEFFGLDFFTFSGSLCEIDTEELEHFFYYIYYRLECTWQLRHVKFFGQHHLVQSYKYMMI